MPSEEYLKKIKEKIKEAGEMQLKALDLSSMWTAKLTKIPGEVFELEHLEVLDLSHNEITIVPESILKLQNLKIFVLKANPIETPPPEIAFDKEGKTNLEGIKNYFRQLKRSEKDYLHEAKLLIVGEAGAGKTTLAKKIEDKDYILNEDEPTTEGIDVIKWEFPLPGMRRKIRSRFNPGTRLGLSCFSFWGSRIETGRAAKKSH